MPVIYIDYYNNKDLLIYFSNIIFLLSNSYISRLKMDHNSLKSHFYKRLALIYKSIRRIKGMVKYNKIVNISSFSSFESNAYSPYKKEFKIF